MLRITVHNPNGSESSFETDLDTFKQWLTEFPLPIGHVILIQNVAETNDAE